MDKHEKLNNFHGTVGGYTNHACRCDTCKEAASVQRKKWRASPTGKLQGKLWASQRRAFINESKNQPCADCGGRYPSYVMHFDHIRGPKCFNISQHNNSASFANVLAEIEKCEVVCANCHAYRTQRRIFERSGMEPFEEPLR